MAHDFRSGGALERAIDDLRARYRRPPTTDIRPAVFHRQARPEEEEEEPGAVGTALETLSKAQEWLKRRGDIAQTYYGGLATGSEEMQRRALVGEPVPSEELAAGVTGWAVAGEPEPGETEEQRLRRAAGEEWGRHAVAPLADPTQLAILGGIGGAAALSPLLGAAAGVGAVGMAAVDAAQRFKEWRDAREEFGAGSEEEVRAKHAAAAAASLAAAPVAGYGVGKGGARALRAWRNRPERGFPMGEIMPEPRGFIGPGEPPPAPSGPIITPPPGTGGPPAPTGRGPRLLGPGPAPRTPYETPGVTEIKPGQFRDWLVDADINARAEGGAAAGITPATRQLLLQQAEAAQKARLDAMLAGVKQPKWTREAEQDLLDVIQGAQREAIENFDTQITAAVQSGNRERAGELMGRRLALVERLLQEEAQNPPAATVAGRPPEAGQAAIPFGQEPPTPRAAPAPDIRMPPRPPSGPETPTAAAARRMEGQRPGVTGLLERGQDVGLGGAPGPPPPGGGAIVQPSGPIAPVSGAPTPVAPPAPPPATPTVAPPRPVPAAPPISPAAVPVVGKTERADPAKWPLDQKWTYTEYDREGNLVKVRPFRTKKAAEEARRRRGKELQGNRREARATGLSEREREVVQSEPGTAHLVEGGDPQESLAVNSEWYEAGKQGHTPALYRTLTNARQLGEEIHPGYFEAFPDLAQVKPTGRRKRISRAPAAPTPPVAPKAPPAPQKEPEAPPVEGPPARPELRVGPRERRIRDEIVEIDRRVAAADRRIAAARAPARPAEPALDRAGAPRAKLADFRVGQEVRLPNGRTATIEEFLTTQTDKGPVDRARLVRRGEDYKGRKRTDRYMEDLAALKKLEEEPAAAPAAGGFEVGEDVRLPSGALATIQSFETFTPPTSPLEPPKRPVERAILKGTRAKPYKVPVASLKKLKEPAKLVDREGQALVPGFAEAAAATPEITEGNLPGGMFTPEAEAIRKREGPAPAAPVQAELPTGRQPRAARPTVDAEGKPIQYAEPTPGMKAAAEQLEGEAAAARKEAPQVPPPRKLKDVALTEEQADHLDRWFKARKLEKGDERGGVNRDRIFGSMQVAKGAMRNLVASTSDYDAAKKLRSGPGTTQAEIQRRKRIARTDRDTYKGVYATALETLKAEVQKIGGTPGHFRRLQQIIEDRVPVREKKAAPLVLPSTAKTIDAMEQYGYLDDVNAETLPERVAAYRDEVPLADADVNREIEKTVIALKARDRVGKTTKTEWRNALAEGAPGLSSTSVKAAVEQGPINPDGTLNKNFDKIMVAMRRKIREQRALEEAMSEDGSTRYTEAYDVAAVDMVATELEARGEESDYGDPPWSIMDPDTGRPALARDILGAITERQGRLYARVLQKHAREMEAADVPFDISSMDDPDVVAAPPPQTWEQALGRLPAGVREHIRAVERLRRRQMGALRAGFEGPEPFTWRDYELQNMERLYAEAEARVAAPDAPSPLSREVEQLVDALPRYESWKTWIRDNTDTIEKLFGHDARLFRVLLGVTSPSTDVAVNVTLALKAHSQMRLGLPFEGFLPSVQQNLESVRMGRVIGGQKVRPYTRALVGFEDAVWVDRWIGRYFFGDQVKEGRVTPAQARKAADLMRQAAEELGWSPREVSSALWAAGQIKSGLSRQEIGSYDRVLEERATAIRRFVDYFGPAAGESERLLNSLVSVAEGEGDPGARGHGASREVLRNAARQIEDLRAPLPAPEVLNQGSRFLYGRLEDGTRRFKWLGTVLADHVIDTYRIRWEGLPIRNLNDLGLAAQVARNPAFETFHYVLVKGNKAVFSIQHSSRLPGLSSIHPEGLGGMKRDLTSAMEASGADGYYLVHNHPSGNPQPSNQDLTVSLAVSRKVPGFKGHVVTDHQTFTTITPQDVSRLAGVEANPEAVAAALQEIGGRTAARVREPVPDPLLRQGIDAEEFWRTDRYKIRGVTDFLEKMLSGRGPARLGVEAQATAQPGWPQLFFLDGESKLRSIMGIHPGDYLNPGYLSGTVIEAGRQMGGQRVLGVIPGLAEARTHQVTAQYLQQGVLVDVIDPRTFSMGAFSVRGRDLPYPEVFAVETLLGEEPPPPWDASRPPDPEPGGAGGGAGAGGGRGGTPPPATPPPDSGPWPGDDGWDARARYAEARARAHTGEWTPRDLWDALVMGARHFAKGVKDFAKWSGLMSLGGIGRFLKRIWNVILSWFDDRVVTRKGRVRDVDDTEAARRMEEGPRPIRPIPRVSKEDVRRVAERLRRPPPPPRPGEKPPEFPINLDWIRDEADVKELFRVFGETLGDEAGRAKGYRSHKRVQELAAELGMSAEQLRRVFKKQGVLTDVQVHTLRMLRQESAIQAQAKRQVYDDLVAQLADTQDPARRAALEQHVLEAERDYHASLHRAMGIWYTGIGAGSEAGRALAAHRILAEWLSPEERAMRRMMRGLRATDEQAATLAEALSREDMAAIQRTYHEIMHPGLLRQFNEYFVNSILSGPATLGANVAGNAGHELLLRTPERGIAGMLDQLGVVGMVERLFGRPVSGKERTAAEFQVAAKALWKYRMGLPAALRYAKEATFKDTFTLVDKEFSVPTIPGVVGRTIRTPSRWMWALDRGAKVAAFGAERSVQVYRRAAREAKRMGWDSAQTKRRVKELDADIDRWMMLDESRKANPRSLSKEDRVWMLQNKEYGGMVKAMRDAALKSTFQDDVLPLTKMLVQARREHPWMTPFVPFIRTPERILIGGLKRTPMGLAEALVQMKRGKIKGGDAADRLAQGVLGTMASIAIYMMAKEGHITGGGPTDWRERSMWLKTGRVPYGFKVPGTDRWYSIARMEPMATTWGFASDLAEAQDAKTAGDFWDKLHYSVLNNITNKTYLEGIISATEAVSDPERYGAQFGKRMIGALVPNLLASAARGIDPTIRQADDIRSTLIARVPVYSTTLPARVSGTGEPLSREEDPISRFISPFRYRDEAGPERNLERLFLETGYIPSAPPKSMRLPGTRREYMLSQQERDLYGAYGRRATLFARKLAADGDWSSLDVFQKEEFLRRIYRFAQDASRKSIYASMYRRVWAGEAEEKPK